MTIFERKEYTADPNSELQLNDHSRLVPLKGEGAKRAYERTTPDGNTTLLTPIQITNSADLARLAQAGNLWLIQIVDSPQQQTTEIATVEAATAFKLYGAPPDEIPADFQEQIIDHKTYQDIDTPDTTLQKGIVLVGLTVKEVMLYRDKRLKSEARGRFINDQLTPNQFTPDDFLTNEPQDLKVGGYIAAIPSAVFQEVKV